MWTRDPDTELWSSESFEGLLAVEVQQAAREGRLYAVIACVPQQLAGEHVADVVRVAASCVLDLLRTGDLAGRLSHEILAIGLPDTDADGARVLVHRLKSDLRLRTAHLRNTVWEAGFACLEEDGTTSEGLLQAAIEAARGQRRRVALDAKTVFRAPQIT